MAGGDLFDTEWQNLREILQLLMPDSERAFKPSRAHGPLVMVKLPVLSSMSPTIQSLSIIKAVGVIGRGVTAEGRIISPSGPIYSLQARLHEVIGKARRVWLSC